MEVDDAADPLGAGGKEGGAEMPGALPLTETGAGNGADTRGVEHAQSVELIGLAALILGLLDSLGGELDGREEVHGTLLMC